ncbi:MAG: LysE/ArgO family amino acid transporter [Trueperaceae bacterium]
MNVLLAGLVTGFGLIVAIGAQNVFVLRQGLLRSHAVAVALTATLTDSVLIGVGVAGVGSIVATTAWLGTLAAVGGAIFLFVYGLLALRSAVRPVPLESEAPPVSLSTARGAVAATLAVSLLNPHVYLDTVVLLGGIGGQLPLRERGLFTIGAVSASALWFFGLALGARALAPLFSRPLARRLVDSFVALVMFTVAAVLIVGLFSR